MARDGTHAQKEHAAQVLQALARDGDICDSIAEAAGVASLLTLLRDATDDDDLAKTYATEALCHLARRSHVNRVDIVDAGGINLLAELVRENDTAAVHAVEVLKELATSVVNRRAIVDACGVRPLVLITYDYGEYKAEAARELLQILSEINGVREQIANYENEIEPGMMHWSSDDSDDDQDNGSS